MIVSEKKRIGGGGVGMNKGEGCLAVSRRYSMVHTFSTFIVLQSKADNVW